MFTRPFKAIFTLSLCLFVLSGCSTFRPSPEVEALNEIQATGNPFTQALTREYRDFVNFEQYEMKDYPDALHFARKGLASARGEEVLPEPLKDWDINYEEIADISAARSRLITVMDIGARQLAPEESAITQVQFDCWIEQAEEGWSENDEIENCKSGFMRGIASLENKVRFIQADQTQHTRPDWTSLPPPSPDAPLMPNLRISRNDGGSFPPGENENNETITWQNNVPYLNNYGTPAASQSQRAHTVLPDAKSSYEWEGPDEAKFIVFFNSNGSRLLPDSQEVIQLAAEEIQGNNTVRKIVITGHSDTVGPESYNAGLGIQRAEAVKNALVSRGISQNRIEIRSGGENELLVPTADNVGEPFNRRVEITFERRI